MLKTILSGIAINVSSHTYYIISHCIRTEPGNVADYYKNKTETRTLEQDNQSDNI